MLHHMDRGNWYVSVYHINCLSGLHKGFINLERSNRGSLPLVIKCKILSGHETLEGFVTTCWITGVGGGGQPHLFCFELQHEQDTWPLTWGGTDQHGVAHHRHVNVKNGHFCTAARHVLQHRLWSVVVEGGERYAELILLLTTLSRNRLIGFKHVHQPALKHLFHMLWSHNEFNTLLSAVSSDFPIAA